MQRAAHVEHAVAGAPAGHLLAERGGGARQRAGDLGGSPVAVRGPDHRSGRGHEWRRERRAVRCIGRLGGLRDALGARGDDPDPVHRRHEIDLRSPRRALPDLSGGARLQPAHAEHSRFRGGERVLRREPLVTDRGNHQRAPELQRAQGLDERTRRTGRRRDVHDLRAVLPQPAECLHEAVLEHRLVAGGRSEDARRQQRRVRRQPHDTHVGPVRDQDAGDGGAVPDRVVRHALAPGREMEQRRLTGREAIVVDARVGHADHHPRRGARAEVDRAPPGRVGLRILAAHGAATLAGQVDRCVALDVAHAGRGAQAPQRRPEPALRQPYERETEVAIEHRDACSRRQRARRRRRGTRRERGDERQEERRGVHETPASRRAAASEREARPRCEIASFSSAVSSATVRSSPDGTNSGS